MASAAGEAVDQLDVPGDRLNFRPCNRPRDLLHPKKAGNLTRN